MPSALNKNRYKLLAFSEQLLNFLLEQSICFRPSVRITDRVLIFSQERPESMVHGADP